MNMKTSPFVRCTQAFTMIELLVVLAIVALLGGLLGVAINQVGPSHAAAQRTLGSVARSLRAQASLSNQAIALVVVGKQGQDGFLQRLDYAVAVPGLENTWMLTGESEWLPKDIFLVPAADHPLVQGKIVTLDGGAEVWQKIECKGLKKEEAASDKLPVVRKPDGGKLLTTYYKILEAKADGKLKVDGKIALAPGVRTSAERVTLRSPQAVLGLESSDYGTPLFLEGADDFL